MDFIADTFTLSFVLCRMAQMQGTTPPWIGIFMIHYYWSLVSGSTFEWRLAS